jgi:hypothetical protein
MFIRNTQVRSKELGFERRLDGCYLSMAGLSVLSLLVFNFHNTKVKYIFDEYALFTLIGWHYCR